MNPIREELVSEFAAFLQDSLQKNPDINMEDFIHTYFDLLVRKCSRFVKML